ncbi:hypothetical protein OHB26_38265 [Nocardia sp. NBC_01503]|uniref:helix-turn-helix domain-containing protein n=1 Tax=Nocardia sp. NBC_01503 TaxID=2975997 RepID=UPI002E7BFBDE|nr:hypothetical protein [Nocardia sp. NBC_01503]WTL32625.1 hypothetical protein OHB26_38265 [Nocardia sp. NBC_01503]
MVDIDWTPDELEALRAALRMNKVEFCKRIGVTARAHRDWLTGQTQNMREANRRQLFEVLADAEPEQRARFWELVRKGTTAPGADEQTTEGVASKGHSDGTQFGLYSWEVGDDDVRRRDFGKAALASSAIVLLGAKPGQIGMSDVTRLREGVAALELEDQRLGGGRLVDYAVMELAKAKHWREVGTYDTAAGDAFTIATGELAVMAGWLAYDADRQALARRCYADAMALGCEANDPALITRTCLIGGGQLFGLARRGRARPQVALNLATRARDLMRGTPPGRIHALIAVREAQAYGLLCERSAFERAIATAWREMDQASNLEPLDECPRWLWAVTPAEIAAHEARGRAEFEEYDRAIALFDSVADIERFPRNVNNIAAWRAVIRARAGDLRGAVAEAVPVLHTLTGLTSIRTLRNLEPIRASVDENPVGGEFSEMFDALLTKATTA